MDNTGIEKRARALTKTLGELRYGNRRRLAPVFVAAGDYSFPEELDKSEAVARLEALDWTSFGDYGTWGGRDGHFWFRTRAVLKSEDRGRQMRMRLSTGATDIWNTDNPQILVYVNGRLAGTLDMNHQEIILTPEAEGNEEYDLVYYAYSNSPGETNFFSPELVAYDEEIGACYYDCQVLLEAVSLLEETDPEREKGLRCLNECLNRIDFRMPGSEAFGASVKEGRRLLQESYYGRRSPSPVTVHSIGHTHIDVAWKWPLRQTRQKAVRSFLTVLELMKRYPEYRFMSSQPQLYQFVKEEAPHVFEQIKERIAQGRFEAEGAMWLEPDCNLASGESLVRHILYGREFMEKELGACSNEVLWLPDVFGYSAALPQIMKKSGLSYFMTTKLGWNEMNAFPYDTFLWKGIDGSQVLTHMITTRDYRKPGVEGNHSTTYNGRQNASQIMGTWQRYQNKDLSKDVLTCYGYGDGGGGPTEEMLEHNRRLSRGVAACPSTRNTLVKEFFHILEENMDAGSLPTWNGELYLETHRGTYTSMGKNKRYNRQCEFLLGDLELLCIMAGTQGVTSYQYPKKDLERLWKLLLLNQFHDILPGSAIQDVYEDSREQYEEIIRCGKDIGREALQSLMGPGKSPAQGGETSEGMMVWNLLSFERTGLWVGPSGMGRPHNQDRMAEQELGDGNSLYLGKNIPPKGYILLESGNSKSASGEQEQPDHENVIYHVNMDQTGRLKGIETEYYALSFDEYGEILSLYDKKAGRELIQDGKRGNTLRVYEDRPLEFDAWNIDRTYREHSWKLDVPEEFVLEDNGPLRGTLRMTRRFLQSVVHQRIHFYAHTGRIDFETRVNWQQHQMLMKAGFALDILCREATYDIQFGNVKRPTHQNTTWEQARFEVCAHKWADISEDAYGAALLNDCKYGYSITESEMELTLLKSGIFPYEHADVGDHIFTYALLPHTGDFRSGRVIQEAYELNQPLKAVPVYPGREIPGSASFLQIEEENVIAETIKQAEDGEDIIIRFYEAYGRRSSCHVELPLLGACRVWECDCMENREKEIPCRDKRFELAIKPYEIKTIRVRK